jgi:hypothetical protein
MDRGPLRTASVLVLLAVLLLPALAHAYVVRPDHPRLLLTEEMLPMLRGRCQTTHADIDHRGSGLAGLGDRGSLAQLPYAIWQRLE